MPPRQEGPGATMGNPDSPPTSRPSMHSYQPSALGHRRFHAHGFGGPGCGRPRAFPAPAPSPRCSPPDARPAPCSPPRPWELSCSANVSRGLASAALPAPPPSSPPGTHGIFLSEFRSRAQTLSVASCSESLGGSLRRVPTCRPKPVPEDLRAQCRQRCTRGPDGEVVLGPELAAPAERLPSPPTGPTNVTPAPALAPSSPQGCVCPTGPGASPHLSLVPGNPHQRQEPPTPAPLDSQRPQAVSLPLMAGWCWCWVVTPTGSLPPAPGQSWCWVIAPSCGPSTHSRSSSGAG